MKTVGVLLFLAGIVTVVIVRRTHALELLGIHLTGINNSNELLREHRFGRFGIDIPVEARFGENYRTDRYQNTEVKAVLRDRTVPVEVDFRRQWERRLAEIEKKDRHRDVDAVIVEKREFKDTSGDIRAVLYYGNSSCDGELYWDVLLKSGDDLVWFRRSGMEEFQSYIFDQLLGLARAYSGNTDEPPQSASPWYHLEKGILRVPFSGDDETKLRFTDHPLFSELTIELQTSYAKDKGKSLQSALSWGKRLGYLVGFGVGMHPVRSRWRSVAGLKGEEVVFLAEAKDEEPTYMFKWGYAGEKGSMSRPEIDIEMEAGAGNLDQKLALWDEMLDSLHYLGSAEDPTRTAVRFAEEQGRVSTATASGLTICRVNDRYGLSDPQGKELLPAEYTYIGEFQDGMLLAEKGSGDQGKLGLIDRHGKLLTPVTYDRIGFFKEGLAIVEMERRKHDDFAGGSMSYRVAAVIDRTGKEITDEEYQAIEPFRNGLAMVHADDGYSFIDRSGKRITKKKYEWVKQFKEGRAVVRVENEKDDTDKYGIIDESGHEVVKPKYFNIDGFVEGVAVLESKAIKYGYLARDGKLLTPIKYSYADSMLDGVAVVSIDERYGLVDKAGRELTKIHFDARADRDGEPLLFSLRSRWGAVDLHGNTIIPFQYRQLLRLNENLIRAIREDDSWGVLDREGKIVVPFLYAEIQQISDGFLKVKALTLGRDKADVGVLARDGQIVIEPRYDEVEEFGPQLFRVVLEGKQGVCDRSGRVVVPVRYDLVAEYGGGLIKVRSGRRFGLVDRSGNEVLPVEFEEQMRAFDNGVWIRVSNEGKSGFYCGGTLAVPLRYNYLYRFDDGRFASRTGQLWGLLDAKGGETAAMRYDSVRAFRHGLARVRRDGKWGYVDGNGKEIIPLRYQFASDFVAGTASVKENGSWHSIPQPTTRAEK